MRRFSFARSLIACLLVAGCTALPLEQAEVKVPASGVAWIAAAPTEAAAPVAPPAILAFEAPQSAAAEEVEVPPLPGHGHIVVRIKWPERAIQAIPVGTQLVRITAISKVTAYSEMLNFTVGAKKGTFRNAPAGTLTLSAFAFGTISPDVSTTPLASASADLQIQSGAVVAARLVLNSGPGPTITGMSPTNGATRAQIELRGTNFGSGSDVLKVYVDDQAVPDADIFRQTISQAFFRVPSWAGNSTVSVSVVSQGSTQSATATDKLIRLKTLALTQTSINLAVNATTSVTASGTDQSDQPVSNVKIEEYATAAGDGVMSDHDHSDEACMCVPDLSVDAYGVLTANKAGTWHVMVKNGVLVATASVIMQ